jgi:hypothetical protein
MLSLLYAECRIFIVILSGIMLSMSKFFIVILRVTMLSSYAELY